MPNTFTQIYIQLVFAVKYRESLITDEIEIKLHKYIAGIIAEKEQKLLAINGMPDHIHILVSLNPDCKISDLVKEIKRSSSLFINQNKLTKTKFQWQEGYGAFSYSQSNYKNVIQYILNQKAHHAKVSFKKEYIEFLEKFEISYDDKYLFDWL